MPWQCGCSSALRSSRTGRRPALGHLRARSLPPGRTPTMSARRTTRKGPPRAAAKRGKQLELRRRQIPRRHRRRGDRKGSAISETPRSGPQAVQDARSARLEEPLLDGRGPGRTRVRGGLRGGPRQGPSAASRRAALALDEARPFGPVSATRRCSGISSVRSFTTRTTSAALGFSVRSSSWSGVARGGAMREDRGGEALGASPAGARASPSPPQCHAFKRRGGVADASAEGRPGAALARDVAGPRSAAREH